jgi:hypothetical protein
MAMAQSTRVPRARQERSRRHCGRAVVLVVANMLAFTFVPGLVSARAAGLTSFSMSPTAGAPGTTVYVSGSGCSPGLVVHPSQDYVELGATTLVPSTIHIAVAPNGSWSGAFVASSLAPAGAVAVAPVCVTNGIPSLTTLYSPQLFTVSAPVQNPTTTTTTESSAPANGATTTLPSNPGNGGGTGGGNSGGGSGNGGGATTVPPSGSGDGGGGSGRSAAGGGAHGGSASATTIGPGAGANDTPRTGSAQRAGLAAASTSSGHSSSGSDGLAGPLWLLLAGLALLTLLAWLEWRRRRHAVDAEPEVT